MFYTECKLWIIITADTLEILKTMFQMCQLIFEQPLIQSVLYDDEDDDDDDETDIDSNVKLWSLLESWTLVLY